MKNNTSSKKNIDRIVYTFLIVLMNVLIIKLREPLYDLMWTDKYPLRPAVEARVAETYDNMDKVAIPVGRKVMNVLIKVGEVVDEIPPRFDF